MQIVQEYRFVLGLATAAAIVKTFNPHWLESTGK